MGFIFRRMNGELAPGQAKNQPAAAGIHVGKLKPVAKEGAIRLRIVAVDDDVSTSDQELGKDLDDSVRTQQSPKSEVANHYEISKIVEMPYLRSLPGGGDAPK